MNMYFYVPFLVGCGVIAAGMLLELVSTYRKGQCMVTCKRFIVRYTDAGRFAEIVDLSTPANVVVMSQEMNGPEDDATIQALCEDMNECDTI